MSTVYARTTGTSTVEYTDPVISPLPITVNGSSVVTLEVFEGAILSNPSNRAVNNNGGTVSVTGATFAGNTVTGSNNGGAFYMNGGTSTLTQTTVIADNRAYRGGAFYVKGGTLTLTGAIIDNNTATNLGSGIYADSAAARITITGSTFSNNKCLGTAANNGGAIFCNNANVVITITGSTFSGNTSVNADGGSAIYNNAGTVSISDTVFGSRTDTIYNKATMSFDGTVALAGNVRIGVVGSVSKTISVRENTTLAFLLADRSESDEVILNYSHLAFSDAASVTWSVGIGADQAAGDYKLLGGGSAVTTASVYDVSVPTTAVAMTVNATPKQLGDKYVWLHTDSSGNLCLRVSDELYAVTSLTGTVKNLYTDAVLPPLTVNGTTVDELEVFTGATMSNASGKALNNTGGAVTITGAIITGSGAGQNTGGAVVNNRTLTVSDTIFGNNTAARQGAAIYNYASSGSAVLTLNNVKFFHNALTEDSNYTYGAALINLAGGTTTVTGGTFSENLSAHYGGAVAVTAGTVAFSGTTFASNSATRGGVFFANGGVLTISDAVLSDNTAEAYGGGVYTESGANVTIAGSTFSGNRASTNGGAIYNNGGSISISDSVFAATTDTIYNNGTMSWSGSITLAGEVGVNTGKSITVADNTALTLLLADRTAADNAILNYGNFSFGDASSITWNAAVASDQAAGDYKLAGAGSAVTTVSVYDVAAPATAITLTTNSEPQQLDGRYVWLHTDSDNNLCLQVADAVYGKSYLGATVKNLYADASMAPVTLDGTTLDKLEVFSGATFSGTSKAVNSTGSTVTVTGALFADIDTAEYGGVAITNINGSLEVSNTTIARTAGASRGAIMNRTGSATPATAVMTDVVFLDNKATAAGSLGGAVFNYATAAGYTASYTQTGGYFSGNTASSGGAIYNDSVMLLTGVTFSGNFASDNGGAIYNARTLTLTNTTFATASDTIHNSGTLTFSGTNALNASVTGSGTITVDSGAALVFANSEAISVAALTFGGNNAVTFNGSAAVNFAADGGQDLSDVAITVDGSAYAGSEIVVATGVSAIGSYTVTGADDLTLYTAGGKMVLSEVSNTMSDGQTETNFVGGTSNLITGGTVTAAFFGTRNNSGSVRTVFTGGTVVNSMVAGALVQAKDAATAALDMVSVDIYDGVSLLGGTANGGMNYVAGYAYGRTEWTELPGSANYTVGEAVLNLSGSSINGNLYAGAHARKYAYTSVAAATVNVTGGIVKKLYGGGWAERGDKSITGGTAALSTVGTATVNISGGSINRLYAGGGNSYYGYTEVGTANLTISGGTVDFVFLGGRNINCFVGDTTLTITGDAQTLTRISGHNDCGVDNTTGTAALNVRTDVTLGYLDYVDRINIAEACTLNITELVLYDDISQELSVYLGTDGFDGTWDIFSATNARDIDTLAEAQFYLVGGSTSYTMGDTIEIAGGSYSLNKTQSGLGITLSKIS